MRLTVGHSRRVNLSEDGRRALMKLSRGDMRRALNVLQACHAAYDITDETAIYNCTGNPHPSDIQDMVQSMMNEEFQISIKRECVNKFCSGCGFPKQRRD